jgi:hypothetical protein
MQFSLIVMRSHLLWAPLAIHKPTLPGLRNKNIHSSIHYLTYIHPFILSHTFIHSFSHIHSSIYSLTYIHSFILSLSLTHIHTHNTFEDSYYFGTKLGSCATFTILGRIYLGFTLWFVPWFCFFWCVFFCFFCFWGELLVHFQLACKQANVRFLCISMDFGFSWFTCEIRNYFFCGQVWFHTLHMWAQL